jgi:hypothetical protein
LALAVEDAALRALASIPRAGSPAFGFAEGQSAQRTKLVLKSGKLRERASLLLLHSGNFPQLLEEISFEKQQGTRTD